MSRCAQRAEDGGREGRAFVAVPRNGDAAAMVHQMTEFPLMLAYQARQAAPGAGSCKLLLQFAQGKPMERPALLPRSERNLQGGAGLLRPRQDDRIVEQPERVEGGADELHETCAAGKEHLSVLADDLEQRA